VAKERARNRANGGDALAHEDAAQYLGRSKDRVAFRHGELA
jgi:hypothetical protein